MRYVYIIIAVLSWGLWGIFNKLALNSMHPIAVHFMNCVVGMVAAVGYLALMKQYGYATTPMGIFWAAAAGTATMVATLACLYAASNADVSNVISITGAYPVITFVVAILFLGEAFTIQKLIGVLLVVVGVFVLGR